MDQQNPNGLPKHVPTPEEIARLEAEAVAALQQGNAPKPAEAPPVEKAPEAEAPQPGFVPYVDDVVDEPKPKPTANETAVEDGEDDYVPGPWEERVNALSPEKWRLVQIVGGAALGLIAIALLFIGGDELATYRLILAALVALLVPRYIERVIRRPLNVARRAMIVAMLVGLIVIFLVIGFGNGFQFRQAE